MRVTAKREARNRSSNGVEAWYDARIEAGQDWRTATAMAGADLRIVPSLDPFGPKLDVQQPRPVFIGTPVAMKISPAMKPKSQ